MKRIITIIVLSLFAVTASAKDVYVNTETFTKLTENRGVYSISGLSGDIVLGDLKTSRDIMLEMVGCFSQYRGGNLEFYCGGEPKYEIKSDGLGRYLIKAGHSDVKLRESDVKKFWMHIQALIDIDKEKKVVNTIKNK